MIRGIELSAADNRSELQEELARPAEQRDVPRMLKVLEELGVREEAERAVRDEEMKAAWALDAIDAPEKGKEPLRALSAQLMARSY